jgi:methyl-accepting chemotaxis protein
MTCAPLNPMNSTASPPAEPLAAAAPPRWQPASAWALALACAALAWSGGVLGLLAAAGVGAAVAWALRTGWAAAPPSPVVASGAGSVGRIGAEVMVSQVVPVWSRQMEVTRDAGDQGLAALLNTFSEISGAIATLTDNLESFSVAAQPGALDGALHQEAPAIAELTAASARAFAQRDAAVSELARCAAGLSELQLLAKEARELARHTRLVAFNASIEANRHRHHAEGSSQAIATELRMLAERMADTGERIERVVRGLSGHVRVARRDGEIADTTPEELRLEIDLCARRALATLLSSLGSSMQGTADLRQVGNTLREQLDAAFTSFQFGDRVSQMLSIVANDMSNFAKWVAAHPRATQSDAAEWLAALEASYTMEEQRSHHHGNVHIERSTMVEFF